MDNRSRIHYVDEHCCFSSRDDVLLVLWRGPANTARIATQTAVIDDLCRRHSQLLALTLVQANDPGLIKQFSDEQIREKYNQVAKKLDGVLHAHAFVLQGSGFVASLVRSASVTLSFFFRSKVINKIFDDLYLAGRWLPTQRPDGAKQGEPDAIEALLRAAVGQMDLRAAATVPAR